MSLRFFLCPMMQNVRQKFGDDELLSYFCGEKYIRNYG